VTSPQNRTPVSVFLQVLPFGCSVIKPVNRSHGHRSGSKGGEYTPSHSSIGSAARLRAVHQLNKTKDKKCYAPDRFAVSAQKILRAAGLSDSE
jgi:hypothetical protein